jgi:hypothetical protein
MRKRKNIKSENLKVIKPQIMLSSNIEQELSKIESNLNKPVTKGLFAWRLHPYEPLNSNQNQPGNHRHTKGFQDRGDHWVDLWFSK